jgi:hypothetical protein
MFNRTAAEAAVVVLTVGILASPVRAELVKLTDEQMDKVTAGAFTVGTDPNILIGFHNGAYIVLESTDNGITYTAGKVTWTTQVLYISTTPPGQGYAVGVLSSQTGEHWDGEFQLPPNYVMTITQTRGVLISSPMG